MVLLFSQNRETVSGGGKTFGYRFRAVRLDPEKGVTASAGNVGLTVEQTNSLAKKESEKARKEKEKNVSTTAET